MIHFAWLLTVSALAMIGELMLGRMGVPAPLFLAVAFYFFAVYPVWRILLILSLLAVVLDLSFARGGSVTLLSLFAALYAMKIWTAHGDCRRMIMQAIPGACLGMLWGVALVIAERMFQQPLTWRTAGGAFLLVWQATFTGLVAMPLLVAFLDAAADRLGMPRYRTAGKISSRSR